MGRPRSPMPYIPRRPHPAEWYIERGHDSTVAHSDEAGGLTLACTCGWISTTILIRESDLQFRNHLNQVDREADSG